jgi:hypothetical protein
MLDIGITLAAHATPSATPLLVELAVATVAVAGLLARRPLARLGQAAWARLAERHASGLPARRARTSGH